MLLMLQQRCACYSLTEVPSIPPPANCSCSALRSCGGRRRPKQPSLRQVRSPVAGAPAQGTTFLPCRQPTYLLHALPQASGGAFFYSAEVLSWPPHPSAEPHRPCVSTHPAGKLMYERGQYPASVRLLEAALNEEGPFTLLGGEVQLWLALAYQVRAALDGWTA